MTVLLLFSWTQPSVAHLDGRKIVVFELSSTKWMRALRRGTRLPLVLRRMIYSSHHMSVEVVRFMCWYVPCCTTLPRGLTLEKVASSHVLEEWGGLCGKCKSAQVWISQNNNSNRLSEPSGRGNSLIWSYLQLIGLFWSFILVCVSFSGRLQSDNARRLLPLGTAPSY